MYLHAFHGLLAEEMGGDEVLFMLLAAGISLVGIIRWYAPLFRAPLLGRRPPYLPLLLITPAICFGILYFILINWADPVVANDWRYIFLFLAGGGMFLTIFASVIPALGLSIKLDVLIQHNPAAVLVTIGAMIGAMLAYAYSNIGEGPTIWTTIEPATLATLTLLFLWLIVELIGGVSEVVTIDRDIASGLRHGAFLIAGGLVLGRAMAGDFVSADDTFAEFVKQGWPAGLMAILAAIMQRLFKPTPRMPKPPILSHGIAPAMIYLLLAAAWVAYLGKW